MRLVQEMPPTRGARIYRKLLAGLAIASVAGITLAVDDLAGTLMDAGLDPLRLDWRVPALTGLLLAGWGLIGWISYRGSRHNLAPPAWAIPAVVGLVWAAILLNRFG